MILDTSFLIDLMQAEPSAVAVAERLEAAENDTPQRIPAQVVYELYIGIGVTDQPDRERRRIQGVLESRPVVSTTDEIARLAGSIDGKLRRDGDHIATSDVIIGATARHFDEPVLTDNVEDFRRIPGVDVRNYRTD